MSTENYTIYETCKFKNDRRNLCSQKSLDIQVYSNFRESARSDEASKAPTSPY